jgi:hypothetical protein
MREAVPADRSGMGHSNLLPFRPHGVPAPEGTWGRADAANEVEHAAEALARELADRLGWRIKVEITARLGGQIAGAAARATPRDGDD